MVMFLVKEVALSALLIFSSQAFIHVPELSLRAVTDASTDASTSSATSSDASGSGGSNACPPVWKSVVNDLTGMFLNTTTGQCTDDARAAIREMFHDCGTWSTDQGNTGGCDGSLILAREAYTRNENNGLQDISTKLLALARKWNVGVADTIVVAANVAVVTCPLGPTVKTFVGRLDSKTPAPDGKLPDMHASSDVLRNLFAAKGIDPKALAALVGAHSTSRSFHQTPIGVGDQGSPQDSTPGVWDVKFYSETIKPKPGDFVFDSDKALAADRLVGPEFHGFIGHQEKWESAFKDAMYKMSLFGVNPKRQLQDCTNLLPTEIEQFGGESKADDPSAAGFVAAS